MSTLALSAQSAPDRHSRINAVFSREPLFAGAALCLAISMVPTAFAMLIDPRTFQGINIWIKPLKFEFALSVYLATLAWFAGWLPRGTLTSVWYRGFAAMVVFAIAAEMIWVGGAAALGVGSHFNTSIRGLYPLMGVFAVVLTSASLVYGVLIWRDTESRLDPVFRLSVTVGLILTFVLTLIAATALSSQPSHFIGTSASDASGFPVMGWSRTGGDLRVAHFIATHAMHAIPVIGLAASLLLTKSIGRVAVIAASIIYAVFAGITFVQALQGRPFTIFGF
jgi:hypothetical protein